MLQYYQYSFPHLVALHLGLCIASTFQVDLACAAMAEGCRRLGNVKDTAAIDSNSHGVGAVTAMFVGIEWSWYVYQIVMCQHQWRSKKLHPMWISDLSDTDDSDADRKQDGRMANGVEQFTVARSWMFSWGTHGKKHVMIAPYIEQSKLER